MPDAAQPSQEATGQPAVCEPSGFRFYPHYLSRGEQANLVKSLRAIVASAPFFLPVMPRSGKPLSVRMTNLGPLGWVSDRDGYRYQPFHPDTGRSWPAIPEPVLAIWREVSGYEHAPQACLVNLYRGKARLGLHRDADEEDTQAPVVSISLGDSALFRLGGPKRSSPTRSMRLTSGDVVVLGGESRHYYHGIDRIVANSSTLLDGGGRLNLTMRRVTLPQQAAGASGDPA